MAGIMKWPVEFFGEVRTGLSYAIAGVRFSRVGDGPKFGPREERERSIVFQRSSLDVRGVPVARR
jgi:hypothetical protein